MDMMTIPQVPEDARRVTFEYRYVTPNEARAWLTKKAENRSIRPHRVERYKRDVLAGRWRIHHQGIAFDTDGYLVDGQHRLQTIVEVGQPVLLLIARNIPASAMPHVDGILPRSATDRLKITGTGVSSREMAVLKMIEVVPRAIRTNYTTEEEIDLAEIYGEAAAFACSARISGVSRAINTVIARAWLCGEDCDRLRAFRRIIGNGYPESNADWAAVTLGKFLKKNGSAGESKELEKYHKAQKALRCFLDGQPRKKLHPVTEDLFPIPSHIQLVRG